jgi:hypothetical protein
MSDHSGVFIPGLLALGMPLAAQAEPPMRFALHAGMVDSQGDLRNDLGNRLGAEAAVSLDIPLNRTLSLRPQLNFQHFPTLQNNYSYHSTRYTDVGTELYKLTAWSLGADCLYAPRGQGRSVYFLAGAYLKAWRLNSSGSFVTVDKIGGTRQFSIDDTTTQDEPALGLGAGYWISRRWGLESRMTFATYRKLSYNTLHLTAIWRL